MQYDHKLKKLKTVLLTPRVGGGGGSTGKTFATCDSLLFDMQHDHVLKKMNLDIQGRGRGGMGGLLVKYLLQCCCIRNSL